MEVGKTNAKKYPNGKFVHLADKSMDKLIPQHSYCYIALNNKNEDFEILTQSVNPIRLKNNPIKLKESVIRELYKQIIK